MRVITIILAVVVLLSFGLAQQAPSPAAAAGTNSVVPALVNFSGILIDINGKPLTGIVGVTFYLYSEQQGGSPLWVETQNVQPDKNGHYAVVLGSTASQGLPTNVFVSGEARWLGVQAQGQVEQPRVMLLSVPYALKAGDAQTVGGLPASAFVLAAPNGVGGTISSGSGAPGNGPDLGGSGSENYIPIWIDNNGDLGNSVLFQSGSGNSAAVGINTTTPAATLDVNGSVISRGSLQLPSTGTATASQGFNSQPIDLQGSAFNSGTGKAIGPVFQFQTEPSGNNTSSPAGTLNLLYGNGSGQPKETGLNIASNGRISFATGQTFPGAGTITGVTAGTGLTGGGTKGNVTLSVNTTFANQFYAQLKAANTFSANQTVNGTMTAANFSGNGSGLTNVDASQLGGLSASAFAQLGASSNTFSGAVSALSFSGSGSGLTNVNAAELGGLPPSSYQPAGSYATTGANSFTGNQSVTGNVSATGSISGATGNFTGLVTEAGALLPASGTATASQGYNSQPLDAVTSAYNSNTVQAVNEDFRWLAEPVGNNTGSPSGKLDLLFGANGVTPTETGLSVASNGQITFATGQTFPGTGSGTVTSVGSGAGLTGGPITTSGTLSIATGGVTNTMLQNSGLTVNAGTALTGGGAVSLGGSTTLNVDTTKIPQLAASNTFTAPLTVNEASGTYAITGNQTATSGTNYGVLGETSSPAGYGVLALGAGSGNGGGIYAQANFTNGVAINALGAYGLFATGVGANGVGVSGTGGGGSGATIGVSGLSSSLSGIGVFGENTNASGTTYGVEGISFSQLGDGVYGENSGGTGVYGTGTSGVVGVASSGSGGIAVEGQGLAPNSIGGQFIGYDGASGSGYNGANGLQVYGGNGDPNNVTSGGTGLSVQGGSATYCIEFICSSGGAGISSIGGAGGCCEGAGGGPPGVGGYFQGGSSIECTGDCGGDGVYATPGSNGGEETGFAGNFQGDLNVTGQIYAGGKDFKIDHPIDPANKYLFHASVESSEMMNIYTGNVTTNAQGEATVQLPEWFEALNTDFRYQLTVIGQFAQAIVAREIQTHQFVIRTSAPNVKVSWQVTGVRQDAYAKAHPLVVEEEKQARLKGFYIHPELYGQPKEKQIEWVRHLDLMKPTPPRPQIKVPTVYQVLPAANTLAVSAEHRTSPVRP